MRELEEVALRHPEPAARHRCRSAATNPHNVEIKRWGTPRTFDFAAEGPRRARRAQRLARRRGRREALRRALHRAARRTRAPASRAGAVHARPARRASTATSNATCRCWSTPTACAAPDSCRSSRKTCSPRRWARRKRYLIPTAEVPLTNLVARRDRRGRRAADAPDRALAVLPRRGRQPRQRRARHDPPAPVREGRAGRDRAPG